MVVENESGPGFPEFHLTDFDFAGKAYQPFTGIFLPAPDSKTTARDE